MSLSLEEAKKIANDFIISELPSLDWYKKISNDVISILLKPTEEDSDEDIWLIIITNKKTKGSLVQTSSKNATIKIEIKPQEENKKDLSSQTKLYEKS